MQVNETGQRFERRVGKEMVFAQFRWVEGRLLITHVEVPWALRGTGEAARLMQEIADHARAHGLPVTPLSLCGPLVSSPSRLCGPFGLAVPVSLGSYRRHRLGDRPLDWAPYAWLLAVHRADWGWGAPGAV